MPQRRGNHPRRRHIIKAGGAAGLAGLAGCFSSDDEDGNGGNGNGGNGGNGNGGNGGNGNGEAEDRGEFLGPDGQVELNLVYATGTDTTETAAEVMANELEDLGFSVSINGVTFDTLLGQYVSNEYTGEGEPEWSAGGFNAGPRDETQSPEQWDLMYGINFNTYPRTPAATDAFWTEQSGTNYYGYAPDVDMAAKYSDFREEPDPEARQEIMAEIFGILSEDVPVNFVSMSDDIVGYQDYIEGPVEVFGGNWDSTTWSATDDTDEYIAASGTDAETLYFPEVNDVPSANRIGLCLDGAYAVDSENQIQPLWLDMEDTGDGQVFVCTLRDNLEWGNGYGQMTAEDWVFQIEEVHQSGDIWDAENGPSTQVGDWEGINVEETGTLEFQLELESVNPDFPLEPVMWGAFCAPKDLYESYAPDADALRQSDEMQEIQYSGNLGPYTFERWDRSSEFVAVRNDDYYMHAHADEMGSEWADAPHFDQYTYRVIEEQSTRLQAFEGGELTTAGIPTDRYQDFVDNDSIDVYEIPQPYLGILAFNQRANGWEELQTREVRQALSMSIDKANITENILRGLAEYTHTFQPEWSEWYDDSQVTEFGVGDSYNKPQAQDYLEEYTSGDYGYDA
ncbi:ABC transporter substrate-binding protein [Halobacteria archaeon AArc-curdl1]|uniref:ABC transporter substrate-binding protein n=1 Tax=Natronosalvus hydrolyticus TaxID=2979988 RepID=A0AAP3E5C8_9EURY|nr:ABC transporter substrate-binding protein [Halobacteria archaeon AArc-curdl1]